MNSLRVGSWKYQALCVCVSLARHGSLNGKVHSHRAAIRWGTSHHSVGSVATEHWVSGADDLGSWSSSNLELGLQSQVPAALARVWGMWKSSAGERSRAHLKKEVFCQSSTAEVRESRWGMAGSFLHIFRGSGRQARDRKREWNGGWLMPFPMAMPASLAPDGSRSLGL